MNRSALMLVTIALSQSCDGEREGPVRAQPSQTAQQAPTPVPSRSVSSNDRDKVTVVPTSSSRAPAPRALDRFAAPATSSIGRRSEHATLSVELPEGWHSRNTQDGWVWMHAPDKGAGFAIFVTLKASLPDEIEHSASGCRANATYATWLGYDQVKWERTRLERVGAEGHRALVTPGSGPDDSNTWALFCIETHMGNKKLIHGVVGYQRDRSDYQRIIVDFVKSWRDATASDRTPTHR